MLLVWLFLCLVLGAPSASASTAITLTDPTGVNPGWSYNQQVLPDANGQVYATVGFKGTYTGAAPSNVDLRFCADGACSTEQHTWTACPSATIGGGNWSCSVNVQNAWSGVTTGLHVQARDTGVPATVSAITSNTLSAGSTPLMFGQSNISYMQYRTGYTEDGNTSNTSCTVTSALYGFLQVFAANAGIHLTDGWQVGGTNIPGGDTVTGPYASAPSFTITPNCATGTTTSAHITLGYPSVVPANPLLFRTYSSGSEIFGAAMPPQPSENSYSFLIQYSPYGNTEGAVTLGNSLGNGINGGVLEINYAIGSTSITSWTSPGGSSSVLSSLATLNSDLDVAIWNQGETDAGAGMSTATYLSNLRNVEAWVQGIRPGLLFMIAPVAGDFSADSSGQAAYDMIKQAQLISIRDDANVFWGGLSVDLEYEDQLHLGAPGRYRWGKRIAQAILRAKGLSSSGYGPTITAGWWASSAPTMLRVQVQQEAGTALQGKNGGSCSGATGFRVFGNGTPATISSVACAGSEVDITTSAPLTAPVTFDYLYSCARADVAALVYDNQPPFGDSDGLPLQPTIGQITAVAPPLIGAGFRRGGFRR